MSRIVYGGAVYQASYLFQGHAWAMGLALS